jgi:hypothetical protein
MPGVGPIKGMGGGYGVIGESRRLGGQSSSPLILFVKPKCGEQ